MLEKLQGLVVPILHDLEFKWQIFFLFYYCFCIFFPTDLSLDKEKKTITLFLFEYKFSVLCTLHFNFEP